MQVGPAARVRHGLGVGVVGRGIQRASLYTPWPRRRNLPSAHHRLSSLGARPADRPRPGGDLPNPPAGEW